MEKLNLQQILKETSESVNNGHTIEKLEEWKKEIKILDKEDKKSLKYAIKILETVIKLKQRKSSNPFKKVYISLLFICLLTLVSGSINYKINNQTYFTVAPNLTQALNDFYFAQNVNITSDLIVGGDVNTTGNITANYFIGDGSQLTGINGSNGSSSDEITSPDGNSELYITDTSLIYNDGTRFRLEINEYVTALISPSGAHTLMTDNTGSFYDGAEIITINDINPNWDIAYGWGDHDGLYSLLNHKTNELYSPNELKNLSLTNTNLVYQDGSSQRFIIDSTGSGIFSPDGNKVLLVTNTEAYANGEVILTSSDLPVDKIVSPDTLSNLTINNSGSYIIGNFTVGDERLVVDEDYVFMQSPTKNHNLMVDNTGAFYDGGEIITVSNFPDIDKIISPDTLSNLTIDDTSLIYINSNGETRFEVDGTQTRIRGVGGSPIYIKFGTSSFEINDGVDRFMSNSDKTVMASANDVWWSATYDDRYEVMDDVRARIVANATETTLISPDGGDILSVANNEFTYNDGVADRILVNSVTSRLVAQNGAYISAGTNSYINDGTRARLQIDNSDTILFSPSGTKFLTLDNDGTSFSGDAVFNDAVGIGNDGLTILSSDLTPSFNILGNGEAFRIQQAQGVNGFFMTWYDNNSNRMSYYGHGQSANQQHLWLINEMTGGNLIIDTPGIVDVQTGLKVSTLTGTGNDYVCVDSTGQMFRSSVGC